MIATKSRTERFDTSSFLVYLLLGLLALVFLFPFYWMMISATMSLPELGQFPPGWCWWPFDRKLEYADRDAAPGPGIFQQPVHLHHHYPSTVVLLLPGRLRLCEIQFPGT